MDHVATSRGFTPWKINGWNLQITHFGKENDLPNLHDSVPAVNLQGCTNRSPWIRSSVKKSVSPRNVEFPTLISTSPNFADSGSQTSRGFVSIRLAENARNALAFGMFFKAPSIKMYFLFENGEYSSNRYVRLPAG